MEEEDKEEALRSNTKEWVGKVDLERDHISNGNLVMLEPTTPKMRPKGESEALSLLFEQEFRTAETIRA